MPALGGEPQPFREGLTEALCKAITEDAKPPAAALHVWDWFVDLDAARGGSGFGLNPIGYAEIEAYARLNGLRLRGWEARALRRMDGARLAKVAGGNSGEVGKVAPRPMSPALFDGLFGQATRAGRP